MYVYRPCATRMVDIASRALWQISRKEKLARVGPPECSDLSTRDQDVYCSRYVGNYHDLPQTRVAGIILEVQVHLQACNTEKPVTAVFMVSDSK